MARRIRRRRHHDQSEERLVAKKRQSNEAHESIENGVLTQTKILRLQRTIGNQATQRAIASGKFGAQQAPAAPSFIQRLPTRVMAEKQAGKASGFGSNVKHYKRVLVALDNLNKFVLNTTLADGRPNILNQFNTLRQLYVDVDDAATKYLGGLSSREKKRSRRKAPFVESLQPKIQQEQQIAIQVMFRVLQNPNIYFSKPKLYLILSKSGAKSGPVKLDSSKKTGQAKGGTNVLNIYNEGFFKATSDKVDEFGNEAYLKFQQKHIDPLNKQLQALAQKGKKPGDKEFDDVQEKIDKQRAILNARQNEYEVPKLAGIDTQDIRSSNRDVASSRLDSLLGANLIARAQFALEKTGTDKIQKGSVMEKAKGTALGKMIESGNVTEGGQSSKNKLSLSDPELQRQLSRLQLLDTLALQVDRNIGNIFVLRDNSGNIVGVTGIDNDMSFGKETNIKSRLQEYPGLSRFVDKQLAERIIALDPQLLRWAMSDLLTEPELDALVKRLELLKAHLQDNKTKLMDLGDWDAASAKGMLDEHSSYLESAAYRLSDVK